MICHCDEVSSRYLITMRYHHTPVRISIINKSMNKCSKDVEKGEPFGTVGGNAD